MQFNCVSRVIWLGIACVVFCISTPATSQELLGFSGANFGDVVLSDTQSASSGIELELAVGSYNNESIRNYSSNSVFAKMGRAVGRLDVLTDKGIFPCTAFLVSPTHLLTNYHCVPGILDNEKVGASTIDAVQFVAGYTRQGVEEGTAKFVVKVTPVESNLGLDYSVLEVLGNPSKQFGHLKLAANDPGPGDPFWVIGHPMGEAQRISREKCKANEPAISSDRLLHTCDTLPGNSGSPVIDASLQQVVGLHHAGSKRDSVNFAIPMTSILGVSEVLQTHSDVSEKGGTSNNTDKVTIDACDDVYKEAKLLSSCFAYRAYVRQCGDHRLATFGHGYIEENCQQVAKKSPADDLDVSVAQGRPWCANASLSLTDITICNSRELSLLDEELAAAYGDNQSDLSDSEQMNWLHQHRDACGDDAGCIAGQYRSRISALRNPGFGLQFAQGLNRQGYCHIVVAARRTLVEAKALVHSYPAFQYAQIFKSQNNWYAFSLGQVASDESAIVIGQMTGRGLVPPDSYCSKGELFRARYPLDADAEYDQSVFYVRAPQDGWLNIRTGPGTQFDVLGRVGNGHEGVPIQSQGNWSEFDWGNGLIGWAFQKFVTKDQVSQHSCTGRVVGLSPIEQYNTSTGTGFLSIRSHPTTRQGHRLSELYLGDEVLVFEETQGWASVVCMSGDCLYPNRGDSASRGWASKKYLDITCSY